LQLAPEPSAPSQSGCFVESFTWFLFFIISQGSRILIGGRIIPKIEERLIFFG